MLFVALTSLYFGSFSRIRFWAKVILQAFHQSLWGKNIVLTKLNVTQSDKDKEANDECRICRNSF